MPCLPPSSLSLVRIVAGDIASPSMATASPFSKVISTISGVSGASSGCTVRW
jgi:hypothetical protein